jgi:hypothetical protein
MRVQNSSPTKEIRMKFAFLGYSVEKTWAAMSKSQREAMFEDCFAYDRKLLKDGYLIDDGAALQPSRTAKTVRLQDGAVLVTDGPFAETKEQLGGVGLLEANDMVHAVELMSKHPGLQYGTTFELRPVDEEALQRKTAAHAVWREGATAVDPHACKFATLGYVLNGGWDGVSQAEREGMLARCIAFDEDRVKRGQWLSGVALQDAPTAKTLRARGGKVVVTDGPFAETKEFLGGIVVLGLKDLGAAVALMSKHPALTFGVAIEVRPMDEEIARRWEGTQE